MHPVGSCPQGLVTSTSDREPNSHWLQKTTYLLPDMNVDPTLALLSCFGICRQAPSVTGTVSGNPGPTATSRNLVISGTSPPAQIQGDFEDGLGAVRPGGGQLCVEGPRGLATGEVPSLREVQMLLRKPRDRTRAATPQTSPARSGACSWRSTQEKTISE